MGLWGAGGLRLVTHVLVLYTILENWPVCDNNIQETWGTYRCHWRETNGVCIHRSDCKCLSRPISTMMFPCSLWSVIISMSQFRPLYLHCRKTEDELRVRDVSSNLPSASVVCVHWVDWSKSLFSNECNVDNNHAWKVCCTESINTVSAHMGT